MKLPVTYVWTHDSIGLGEDGPTHQPVEHLAALRAIPGLDVVRPADANETVDRVADDPRAARPPGRPDPVPAEPAGHRPHDVTAPPRASRKGAYVLAEAGSGIPEGHPHRDRLRGAASRSTAREMLRGRGHAYPGRVDAVPGVVRGAGRVATAAGAAAGRPGPGLGRGCGRPRLARLRRRRRRVRFPRTLRRQRAATRSSTNSSASPRSASSPRRTPACPRSAPPRAPPPATSQQPSTEGLPMSDPLQPALRGRCRRLARRPRRERLRPATWPT